MRQLAYLDIASLHNTPDWVSVAGERFGALGKKTLFVDIALHIPDRGCKKSAQAFNIERPHVRGVQHGMLPDFPHVRYRWHNQGGKHCCGLDLSGECSKESLVALLRHMDTHQFTPKNADVMMFFHGDVI